MEIKLEFIFIEVKAIDGIEGLMDEQEFDCIMVMLKAENNTFQIFSIEGVGCHGNKKK